MSSLRQDPSPNLRLVWQMYPGLELPELPADTPEAQWKFYPLNVAPPVPGHLAEAAGLHKTVPRWSEGWELEWHGTSLYGISSCLAIGEVMPSEADNVHNGTACGRVAYTTQSHAVACKYAINHYFGDWESPSHKYVAKMLLLVAIPAKATEALPQAHWEQVDRSQLSKGQRKRTPGWRLSEEDSRLNRREMRLGADGQGTLRERIGRRQRLSISKPLPLGRMPWGFWLAS